MGTETRTSTLTRVREAQDALDEARAAIESVQSGLSVVESIADEAKPTRRHPVRNTAILVLIATIVLGALMGVRNVSDS